MATVKSVNTQQLIEEVAGKLQKDGIEAPEWSENVKTGPYAQRPPENDDWWYFRTASILRRIYLYGPVGTNKLRSWYGGKENRGSRPEKHKKSGGKIIRSCMQQLEQKGYVKKLQGKGRVITPKGQSLLEKTASEIEGKTNE